MIAPPTTSIAFSYGYPLHYYDNKKRGEVDFLIDDFNSLSVLPVEVKSGKDYRIHTSLARFMANEEYNIPQAIVFCNDREVTHTNRTTYMPVYYSMFLQHHSSQQADVILPEL